MSHPNDKAPLSQPLTVEIGDANNGRTESNNNLFPNGNICANNNDDDSESLGPLPPKWERAYTESGEVYFIDHGTGTSHWLDPRLSKFQKKSLEDCLDDELPYGWEKISDPHYGTYFIDHVNRRTQYENPVLQAKRAQIDSTGHTQQQSSEAASSVNNEPRIASAFTRNPAELCGQRVRTALVKSSRGLGFTIVGGDDRDGADEFLQIKSVVPKGPAWLDGRLRTGDVIVRVNDVCVLGYTHGRIVRLFQSIPAGSTVALEVCRGYPLPFDPNDPNTEVVTTIAVDSHLTLSSPTKERGRLGQLGGRPPPLANSAAAAAALVDTNYNLLAQLYGPGGGGGGSSTGSGHLEGLDDKVASDGAISVPTQTQTPSGPPDDISLQQQMSQMSLASPSPSPLSPTSPTSTSSLPNNSSQPIQEVLVAIVKGNLGFGFTIADSACGQRVKKILDRQRCKDLQEGDVLLAINDCSLLRMAHDDVVQVLKNCAYNSEATICVQRGGSGSVSKSAAFFGRGGNKTVLGGRKALGLTSQLPLMVGGNGSMFRSKTPTADIYSTQPREVLPSRPKTPVIDTRHIHSTTTKAPPQTHNGPNLYADRAQLRLSLIDTCDDRGDCDRLDGEGETEALDVDVDVDVDLDVDDVDNVDQDMDLRHQLHHIQHHMQMQQQHLPPDHIGPRHKYHRYDCQCYACYATPTDERRMINGDSNASNGGGMYDVLPSASPVNGHHLLKMNNVGPWWPNGPIPNNGQPQHMHNQVAGTYQDMSVVLHRQERGFGFRIVGGIEDRSQVAVGHIVPGGAADLDGRLRTGDELLSVDGCTVVKASHRQVVRLMSAATARGQVSLILRRRQPAPVLHPPQFNQPPNPTAYDVTVTRAEHEGFGFVIISSVNKIGSTIGRLIEDSPAERCGRLRVGDFIVAVNRIDITHLSHGDIVNLIKESGLTVTLTIAPTTD